MLLVIELKTELVDVQATLLTLDRKVRLALEIARKRGWAASDVSVWLVLADSSTNRRHVHAHAAVLRNALPHDGRTVRQWLREPSRPIRALSFWRSPDRDPLRRGTAPIHRVSRRAPWSAATRA